MKGIAKFGAYMALVAMGGSLITGIMGDEHLTMYMTLMAIGFSTMGCIGMQKQLDGLMREENRIIAKVNRNEISKKDYEVFYKEVLRSLEVNKEIKKKLNAQKEMLMDKLTEKLIQREVLLQKAKELNITCTNEELEKAFQEVKMKCDEQSFEVILEEVNMTEEEYLEELRKKIITDKVKDSIRKIAIEITEEEVAEYYEQNKAEYIKRVGADIQYILVYSEHTDKKGELKVELGVREIEDKLASGMSFEEIAQEINGTEAEEIVCEVQDFGFVEYEKIHLEPEIVECIKMLAEGEISAPLKVENGYYFIKVENILEEEIISRDAAIDKISKQLSEEKKCAYYENQLNKWVEEARIEKY